MMKNKLAESPFFSIIMPTYNQAHFIKESIETVLEQTLDSWELIIIDNFSSDETEEIINKFNDFRIRYAKFSNYGSIAKSRNKAIQLSRGKYISFLDSDDLWHSDKLQNVYNHVLATGSHFIYHDINILQSGKIIDKTKSKYNSPKSKFIYNDIILKNFISTVSVSISREAIAKIGEFKEEIELKGAEDWDLWIRMSEVYEATYIDKPLATYRYHEEGVSKNPFTMETCINKVFKTHILDNPSISQKIKNKAEYLNQIKILDYFIKSNERTKSIKYLFMAFVKKPFAPLTFNYLFLFLKSIINQKTIKNK